MNKKTLQTRRTSERISQRKNIIKTEIPIEQSKVTKWSEEEIQIYLDCIMQYGHKNFEKLTELFPTKSTEVIKTFLRTAFDIAVRLETGHPNLDGWLQQCKTSENTPWKDSIEIAKVVKYLSVSGLIENHPLPTQSRGINFSEAYRLIYQALMGYPLQPVNQETADFVLGSLKELVAEIKKETLPLKNVTDFVKLSGNDLRKDTKVINDKTASNQRDSDALNGIGAKKPLRVYERKRPKLCNSTSETPSLKIIVEANESSVNHAGTKDFSVRIENENSEKSTSVVNVPVPVQMESLTSIDKNEQELLKSASYNPFKIPEVWLKEPLFINLLMKNHNK